MTANIPRLFCHQKDRKNEISSSLKMLLLLLEMH